MTHPAAAKDSEAFTRLIAEWVASTGTGVIPDEVGHHVRRCLLDYLAASLVGSTTPPARTVRDYLAEHDSEGTSVIIGTGGTLSPANAACANGTSAHALDLDDGYTAGGFHPGATVISASIAAAQSLDSAPEAVTTAIALGYEVACRLAGSTHPHQRARGFHNTAIAGTFGATTAVGRLLGLDSETLANAYGLAGSHAGGLNAYLDEGSDVKRYHAGKAARDGVVSAELAQRGLTAPTIILEAPHGYLHAFSGDEFDRGHLLDDLGSEWRMLDTYSKPYPCCRHLHGAIDSALAIRDQTGLSASEITAIHVETFSIAAQHDRSDIGHMLDAQMSLPYAIGATLVFGSLGIEQFGPSARADERVRRLMELTRVTADPDFTSEYPRTRGARVAVTAGGQTRVATTEQPYGEPANPMTDQDIEAKFARFTQPLIGAQRVSSLIDLVWSFDDMSRFFAELATPIRDDVDL